MKEFHAALICGSLMTLGIFGIAVPSMVHQATLTQCAQLAAEGSTNTTAQWCAANGYASVHSTGFIRQ